MQSRAGILLCACLLLSQAVKAADVDALPQVGAPPVVGLPWTGVYLGASGGFGFGYADNSALPAFTVTEKLNGPFVGGFAGVNYQSGSIIFGIEADAHESWISHDVTSRIRDEISAFGTLRARLGWAYTPTSMGYITGGGAYGQYRTTVGALSLSENRAGFALGTGSEARLGNNWAIKAEFMYLRSTTNSAGQFVWATLMTVGASYAFR